MEREIDRFRAKSDEGHTYVVVIYQEFHRVEEVGSPTASWVPGMKRLALSDGSPLNRIDDNTFKIVFTNKIIRKV